MVKFTRHKLHTPEFKANKTREYSGVCGPIKEFVAEFLLSCRIKNMSPKTIDGCYGRCLSDLIAFCAKNGIAEIENVKRHVVEGFLREAQQRGNSPHTIKHIYQQIHPFFNYLSTENESYRSPMTGIRAPKVPKLPPKAITVEDLRRVLAACGKETRRTHRDSIFLRVGFDTGARLSELLSIRVEDIDQDGTIIFRKTKNGSPRAVKLGRKTFLAVMKYRRARLSEEIEYLFPNRAGRDPIDKRYIQTQLQMLGRRVGVKLSPHRLRHGCARAMLLAGADVLTIQQRLGHSAPTVTLHYAQLFSADALERGAQFSPGDRL